MAEDDQEAHREAADIASMDASHIVGRVKHMDTVKVIDTVKIEVHTSRPDVDGTVNKRTKNRTHVVIVATLMS